LEVLTWVTSGGRQAMLMEDDKGAGDANRIRAKSLLRELGL